MIQRLDKFLADAGLGTRKEIKTYLHSHRVTVDGKIVSDPACKADYSTLNVEFDSKAVEPFHYVLCMLNKPFGYVTSTDDPLSSTVMELVPERYKNMGVVPVGRLDKDTEGVLLFTNDGELQHALISPKKNLYKTYRAKFEGVCPEDALEQSKNGIVLKDGTVCKSAIFNKISDNEFELTITEGMYHQVKRMAAALGMHVIHLERISFAGLTCENMERGMFKELPLLLYKHICEYIL